MQPTYNFMLAEASAFLQTEFPGVSVRKQGVEMKKTQVRRVP
jgi:hypothetical protein